MTCVVGIIDKTRSCVIIGGDSAESNSTNIFIRNDAKVFRNKQFLFGCTSSYRMIQLLRYSFNPPELSLRQSDNIHDYMCTRFIDAVRLCFKNGGFMQKNIDGDEKGGCFLVGYKNKLYKIQPDFQVSENLNGIDAVGCGADFALGAIYGLQLTNLNPEDKIVEALKASAQLCPHVHEPWIIEST